MQDFIYALKEKATGIIFYIGRTEDPKRRFSEHIYGAKNYKPGDEWKYEYASTLNTLGLEWELEIVMVCGPGTDYYEDYFVNKFRLEGHPLQNMKAGDSEPWMGREYSSPEEFVRRRERLIKLREERKLRPKVKKQSDVELTRWAGDFGKEEKISPGLAAILNRRKR